MLAITHCSSPRTNTVCACARRSSSATCSTLDLSMANYQLGRFNVLLRLAGCATSRIEYFIGRQRTVREPL